MTTPIVTVYTKTNCQPCAATKRWLNERGIPFTEADATEPGNLAAIQSLGYREAPVVIVTTDTGEHHWSGFNPNELNQHLTTKENAA